MLRISEKALELLSDGGGLFLFFLRNFYAKHMKRLFIVILGLGISLSGLTQPCLPNGITFNTQSQIDSFQVNFPNCTGIEGDVVINGINITNLYGLNEIASIGGGLAIVINDSLTTLGGLENLVSVGATLTIFNNPLLHSLTGLEKLNSVGGSLAVFMNNMLPNLIGLDSLKEVGGDFHINTDSALMSLNGLKSLTSIGGDFGLWNNPVLSDLNALEGLTSVKGSIGVTNNNSLTSLKGLDNVKADSINSLHITSNSILSACAVKSICDYLAIPYMLIEILDNATGCNSEAEVDTACMALSVDNNASQDFFSIYPNPVSTHVTIESTTTQPGIYISIINLQGINMITCPVRENKTILDVNNLPGGVYLVKIISLSSTNNYKLVKN